MTSPNTQQADVDRLARELYDLRRWHVCGGLLTLADELQGRCPNCSAVLLAGPDITPEQARAMLATLKARRRELGLSERA